MDLKTKWVVVAAAVAIAAAAGALYLELSRSSLTVVKISTTTSLYATGLLDYLAQQYEASHPGVRIEFVAVGTGAALKYAAQGDVCAVFVHAPNLERKYLDMGVIADRHTFAYNYFVIVGPADDPANVSGAKDAVEAFARIYRAAEEGRAAFVSRGDNSGTHVRETAIWNRTGLDPSGRPWYKSCGCGMDQALIMANELRAYTLSDLGTFTMFYREGRLPNLKLLYQNSTDPNTINIYSAYVVSSCTGSARQYTEDFLKFVYDNQVQLVGTYGADKYGQPLFYPARDNPEIEALWRQLAGSS